jgi:2-C-methyl-D-erythritol 2,4-cyclodiphosphate synthase
MPEFRIGSGYDVHRLVDGKRLIIGGVEFEYPMGLEGSYDADVLTRAVVDALLGAVGLGDIGDNFSPEDPKFQDISSMMLLELVKIKIAKAGYQIENIDATIICEEPELGEAKLLMAELIARELDIDPRQVSVKATATDGLGRTGENRGIAATAVVLVSEIVYEEEEEEESEFESEFADE